VFFVATAFVFMNVHGLKCFDCDTEHNATGVVYNCPKCGGNQDIVYDYHHIKNTFSRDSLVQNSDRTIWRYRPLLPINEKSQIPFLQIGGTPVYSYKAWAAEFGIKNLIIKDDGRNPSASFKDRASAVAIVKSQESGAAAITCASTGNAASSLACICASVGMPSYIFVPKTAPEAKIAQLLIFGANVLAVDGTYDQAFDLCIEASQEFGWYCRNTGFNPYTREGKKTAAFELAEQLNWELPEYVVISMGDGNILSGLWKGFRDLYELGFTDRMPKLIGVQAEGAMPLVTAFNNSAPVEPISTTTFADSISVVQPRDASAALKALRDSGGHAIAVNDEQISSAQSLLAKRGAVFAEPAAAASFAGFLKLVDSGLFKQGDTVAIIITGNGLKDIKSVLGRVRPPQPIAPEINAVRDYLNRR
jgi:threonine synthase